MHRRQACCQPDVYDKNFNFSFSTEVYAEPVSLLQANKTEYVIVLVVMGFVGISAAALVCLAVAVSSVRTFCGISYRTSCNIEM